MRIKLDENLPVGAALALRQMGHDVDTVEDEGLCGAVDPRVIAAAASDGRALVTLDKGLADIRTYPPTDYAGIVLLRPATSGPGAVLQFLEDYFPLIGPLELRGHLVVISDAGVRVR